MKLAFYVLKVPVFLLLLFVLRKKTCPKVCILHFITYFWGIKPKTIETICPNMKSPIQFGNDSSVRE